MNQVEDVELFFFVAMCTIGVLLLFCNRQTSSEQQMRAALIADREMVALARQHTRFAPSGAISWTGEERSGFRLRHAAPTIPSVAALPREAFREDEVPTLRAMPVAEAVRD